MAVQLQTIEDTTLQGYTLRPAALEDLEAVVELFNACSMHDLGIAQSNLEDQRREWQTPGFDLASSTRVAISQQGQLVAYYEVWDQNTPPVRINVWGRIHPQHTGRGLSSRLLDWAIERAREALPRTPAGSRVSLGVGVYSHKANARRFFEGRGLTLVRHYLRMVIDLAESPQAAELPVGITIRSMRRGQDERRVVQAVRESFQDHWGYVETPFEENYQRWMSFIDGNPDFDPDLWLMAEENGQVAGISLCWKNLSGEPDLGWVGTLGVLRPWRRRGLGMALLRQSFVELYRRGQRKVGLGVDATSLTGATLLYEKAGMRSDPRFQISFYELELRPGVDLATQQLE